MQKYKFLVIYSICEGLFYAKKRVLCLKRSTPLPENNHSYSWVEALCCASIASASPSANALIALAMP